MNKEFENKLNELVEEFNSMGLWELRLLEPGYKIRAKGEIHFHNYFICLNVSGVKSGNLIKIAAFIGKYKGSLVIHPVKYNETLCIRIDDGQFF